MCLQNIKSKLNFVVVESLCGQGTSYYFTENFMKVKSTQNINN